MADDQLKEKAGAAANKVGKRVPELWQVVVECRDEAEQREVFERMKGEGRKVRLHVL